MSSRMAVNLSLLILLGGFDPAMGSEASVDLSIQIDDNSTLFSPVFIYVKGELSGILPGIVSVPSVENVPIEIGIEGIKTTPWYSFTFGPDALKNNKVEASITNISKQLDIISLQPDTKKMIKITQENGIYVIKLPTDALSSLGKDSKQGRNGTIGTPYEIILPVEKGKDYGDSKHITYDKQDHKIISLDSVDKWSGAVMAGYREGLARLASPDKQQWTITSVPPGAEISTEAGVVGNTASTIEVVKSISSFAILNMKGYRECVILMDDHQQGSERECRRITLLDGSLSFVCKLKKGGIEKTP
jgi:hypothetical protein